MLSNFQDSPLAGRYLLKAERNARDNFTEGTLNTSDSVGFDRGFYMCGDEFVDDFVVGSTVDIPGGELEKYCLQVYLS